MSGRELTWEQKMAEAAQERKNEAWRKERDAAQTAYEAENPTADSEKAVERLRELEGSPGLEWAKDTLSFAVPCACLGGPRCCVTRWTLAQKIIDELDTARQG